jgi:hypothetical protein
VGSEVLEGIEAVAKGADVARLGIESDDGLA